MPLIELRDQTVAELYRIGQLTDHATVAETVDHLVQRFLALPPVAAPQVAPPPVQARPLPAEDLWPVTEERQLTHSVPSRLLSGGMLLPVQGWTDVLDHLLAVLMAQGLSPPAIGAVLGSGWSLGKPVGKRGYVLRPTCPIWVLNMSARTIWNRICRLADRAGVQIRVDLRWTSHAEPAFQVRQGRVISGSPGLRPV